MSREKDCSEFIAFLGSEEDFKKSEGKLRLLYGDDGTSICQFGDFSAVMGYIREFPHTRFTIITPRRDDRLKNLCGRALFFTVPELSRIVRRLAKVYEKIC